MHRARMAARAALRVGAWMVHPDRGCIRRGDTTVELEPRVMELLVYLAEHRGETVSVEQLLTELWRGTFYGDSPVQRAVALLRRALGDSATSPTYLQTIRKRGYRLVADVVDTGQQGDSIQRLAADWAGGNPFPGLCAFSSHHAAVFFGRSDAAARLLRAMQRQRDQHRFVLVVGPSGSGKTSLVQAGLLPLLRRDHGFDGLRACADATVDLADVQGADPLLALAIGMSRWIVGVHALFPEHPADLAVSLADADTHASLCDRIDVAMRSRTADAGAVLVLAIDHAEALHRHGTAAARFGEILAVLCGSPHVAVVMLCRSDLYASLITGCPAIARLKDGDGHVDLLPPSAGEIAEIIRQPMRKAGLTFESDPATQVRLDDRLRDDATEHRDSLPLLQSTLHALFERCEGLGTLTFAAYDDLGGIRGAIARQAEACLDVLPSNVCAALPGLLFKLVVLHDSGDIATSRGICSDSLASHDEIALAHAMVEARLLVSGEQDGGPVLRLAHDALLRAWPRASEWLAGNRRHLQAHDRLCTAARRWMAHGRRQDLLLGAGLALEEARDLQRAVPELLAADERAFVASSEAGDARRRRRRITTLAMALALATFSTVAGYLALRSHADAERRQMQASALIDYMLNDLSEQLRPMGRLQLMEGIAERALAHLGSLPPRDLDPDMRLNRARALRTSGEILLERGNAAAAENAFLQAANNLDGIETLAPDAGDAVLRERGTLSFWQGTLAYRQARHDTAERHWTDYHATARELHRRDPASKEWRLELSYALNNLGTLAQERGHPARALPFFLESVSLKRAILEESPSSSEVAADLADSLGWLASAMDRSGHLDEAMQHHLERAAVLERLLRDRPEAHAWLHQRILARLSAADIALARDARQEAVALHATAIPLLEMIVATESDHHEWRRTLAYAQFQQGTLALAASEPHAALDAFERARATLKPLLENPRAPQEWRRLSALVDMRSGLAHRALGHVREAVSAGTLAVDVLDALQRANPDHAVTAALFATAQNALCDTLADVGKPTGEPPCWTTAYERLAPHVGEDSADRRLLEPFATALLRLGRTREARPHLDRLLAMGHRPPSPDPLVSPLPHQKDTIR